MNISLYCSITLSYQFYNNNLKFYHYIFPPLPVILTYSRHSEHIPVILNIFPLFWTSVKNLRTDACLPTNRRKAYYLIVTFPTFGGRWRGRTCETVTDEVTLLCHSELAKNLGTDACLPTNSPQGILPYCDLPHFLTGEGGAVEPARPWRMRSPYYVILSLRRILKTK
jgi:hypothetical protein